MTPEEKFNNEIWWVLQEIRIEELQQRKAEPIEWILQARPIPTLPPIGVREKMLLKIEEFGGIKIISREVVDNTYGKDFIYTFELLQPKFDELYNEYKGKEQKKFDTQIRALKLFSDMTTPPELQRATQTQDKRPFCVIEGKLGFLKFNKQGQKNKIGEANSQSFKLLKCLTEPFGIAKSVDVVFEAIREGVKYKSKSGVYTSGIDKLQKIRLIGYAIKELQKGDKLQSKLAFKWDDPKIKIWLEYLG